MAEEIVREIRDPAGDRRVLVICRADGRFTYRRQERHGPEWGPMTIDAGVFDSADTAETEARQRVSWLKALFH